ncbi:MAG: hypothetical protein GEU90_06885 [Gemmatimonas sp.]|nr:hypothetical protein [Gemmatimonas sp.]
MLRLFTFLTVVLLGCAPRGEPSDSLSPGTRAAGREGRENILVGVVRIVGSAPVNLQVVVQPEGERTVRLLGPLVPELENLAGVRVAVEGDITESPDPIADRQLEATRYEIVEVDGSPVVMGEIISVSDGNARLRTADGEEVNLSGVPEAFRVGQKVWIQGPRSVAVQAYGMIRQ